MASIDPTTGLPQVAPNQFWRVGNLSSLPGTYVSVELRQRFKNVPGSFLVGRTASYSNSPDIVSAAFSVLVRIADKEAVAKRAQSFVGDYPPKKLDS